MPIQIKSLSRIDAVTELFVRCPVAAAERRVDLEEPLQVFSPPAAVAHQKKNLSNTEDHLKFSNHLERRFTSESGPLQNLSEGDSLGRPPRHQDYSEGVQDSEMETTLQTTVLIKPEVSWKLD